MVEPPNVVEGDYGVTLTFSLVEWKQLAWPIKKLLWPKMRSASIAGGWIELADDDETRTLLTLATLGIGTDRRGIADG